MTLLIVLASVAVYLAVGCWLAIASIPALWRRAERKHQLVGFYNNDPRPAVAGGTLLRLVLWPVMGPYELMSRSIDRNDPSEQERIRSEQAARIVDLERELGIR